MSHDASHRYEWNAIPWRQLEVRVFKLQRRIYQATTRGEVKKAHRLQKLLASSWSAKSLAVRRVTQENTGKKTAGVDGRKNLTPPQRLKLISDMDLYTPVKPVRRVWIDKPGKPEKRPLGIPIMHDRATQALVKLATEPEWEAKFEPNSFGFRPGRSCQDALQQIFLTIQRRPRYVLDADIASCFDKIDQAALLQMFALTVMLRLKRCRKRAPKNTVCLSYFSRTGSMLSQGASMKPHGVFLLAVVLCAATEAMAQPAKDLQAERMADKLWWILDITKQYQPQFQAHVTLEAPDGDRLALTFQGESARTLVHDDVIALERKPGVQADLPEHAMGAYFIPHLTKWGKPRWWSERAKHEGQEISKAWKLYRLQKRVRETAV